MSAPRRTGAYEPRRRPVVAHVNYSFFHSTQSFLYFYLSRLRRVRPICLTRAPESAAVKRDVPGELAEDFYVYGGQPGGWLPSSVVRDTGVAVRRLLTRVPSPLSQRVLLSLNRTVVPRLRADADPEGFVRWAREILERREARIVHAFFGAVAWRLLPLRRQLNLPLVVTFLGDDVAPELSDWWSSWIRTESNRLPRWPVLLDELVHESDMVLVEGPHLRDRLLALGCPAAKLHIQRIAIPVDDIPFRARRQASNAKTTILFAGRFCEQKGLLFALEAVRILRAQRRDFELRLVGDETMTDGSYAALVYDYIRRHRLADFVRPLGFLNHADYLAELDRADIFLHPSVTTATGAGEGGAPTTIIEAQAAGLPIVSTEHCDIPNVTVPARSAILVAERDAVALAEALRQLLDAPDTWEGYGRAGREHVERFHDIDTEVAALEDRYFELLDR